MPGAGTHPDYLGSPRKFAADLTTPSRQHRPARGPFWERRPSEPLRNAVIMAVSSAAGCSRGEWNGNCSARHLKSRAHERAPGTFATDAERNSKPDAVLYQTLAEYPSLSPRTKASQSESLTQSRASYPSNRLRKNSEATPMDPSNRCYFLRTG